jgi:uncharacterized protein (TIGR03083 family)
VELGDSWDRPVPLAAAVLADAETEMADVYHDGVRAVLAFAARFTPATWNAPTPCPEWRAADLAGHLRCVADDYHEYLDDAPVSRLSRLMASGPSAQSIARKLARQNAAELAALPDVPPAEHIAAFATSATRYAVRIGPLQRLPHHTYQGKVITVAGMASAACVEWHLHAWDLASALGMSYRPADPAAVRAAWLTGIPQLPLGQERDSWLAVLRSSGRLPG